MNRDKLEFVAVRLACTAIITIGIAVMLTACGGGECDDTCKADLHEATTLPVSCAASGACS